MRVPGHNDLLLNDWGIHHFHLGLAPEPGGYQQRTGPLLYAWVADSDLYAITIQAHAAWTDEVLLNEVLDHWPGSAKRG